VSILFEELRQYVGFGAKDEALLAELRPLLAPGFRAVAEEFYDRTRDHEAAHAVFSGEEQIDRLKQSLTAWLERVFTGPYDRAYYERTSTIGHVHVKVGLPHRYMFTAMSVVRTRLAELARAAGAGPAHVDALHKALDLELVVMVDRYFAEVLARAQRAERAELEAVLERTEHRYASAVEMADLLIVAVDKSGKVQLWNREAERVSGVARTEALGASLLDVLVPEEARPELDRAFALLREKAGQNHDSTAPRSIRGAEIVPPSALADEHAVVDSVVRTPGGKSREVRWQLSYRPSREEDGIDVFAIGRDVTEERELAARARQNERLAAVGTLAAGLAHEIRNPLHGALLHVTFLERAMKRAGAVDPDAADALGVVKSEIQRLSNLTTDFLDFARPRPLDRVDVDLGKLCERVSMMVSGKAAEGHVTVRLDPARTPLVVSLDASKIEQVLLNLAQNGIEAMAPAGGTLVMRIRRKPVDALIEVEDTGPGLSADAPVFDPFYSTKPAGTGLGLAIAHSIVAAHGGTLDFESRPGKTVFRVTLPYLSNQREAKIT
jgi:PAS domain S-box-containing protein